MDYGKALGAAYKQQSEDALQLDEARTRIESLERIEAAARALSIAVSQYHRAVGRSFTGGADRGPMMLAQHELSRALDALEGR